MNKHLIQLFTVLFKKYIKKIKFKLIEKKLSKQLNEMESNQLDHNF